MSIREPRETVNLAERYDEELMPWSRALEALGTGSVGPEFACFLSTVRPNGRPHCAGIGVAECNGELYFTSGPAMRKARNLAASPACTISARLPGIDLVLEGVAARVTDQPTLERAAARYRDGGWPAQVEGEALTAPFSAPSAGPPPWHLYRFRFHTVTGGRHGGAIRRDAVALRDLTAHMSILLCIAARVAAMPAPRRVRRRSPGWAAPRSAWGRRASGSGASGPRRHPGGPGGPGGPGLRCLWG